MALFIVFDLWLAILLQNWQLNDKNGRAKGTRAEFAIEVGKVGGVANSQ
jgi:hypothetical protein